MNKLTFFEFQPAPKPKHGRKKEKQKDIPHDIRAYVMARDHQQCVRCGNTQGLQLHHLITRGRFDPRLYNLKAGVHDPRNLCVVCWRCHDAIHRFPDVMKEMLDWQRVTFGEVRKFATEE